MNACLDMKDVHDVGMAFLDEFDRDYGSLDKDLCGPFNQEASRIEAKMVTIYGMVAKTARSTESVEEVGKLWRMMADLCEGAERRLARLLEDHPGCNAEPFRDSVAQMRNKCLRLAQMHS